MLGSFKIGSVLGITVRVHWLFLALVLMVALVPEDGAAALEKLGLLLMLFGVVFLHELGHSLVARRFGIRVYDITFWPLGGMARMSEIPERARTEFLIAIAGPAVNFALAALALPAALWALAENGSGGGEGALAWLARAAGQFVAINLALGVFNLLPAFPMDGGRVLRAILGRSGDWVGATEKAVRVGRLLAFLMIALGLALADRGFLFLPLIGVFVWFTGARELWAVRARHGRIPFGSMAGQAFPDGGAGQVPAGARGAGAGPPAGPAAGPHRPLTVEEIERLERFRGPLRQFRPGP